MPKQPPRRFTVGNTVKFEMQDCGTVHLQPDEQVTFVTEQGAEYDLARKDWGFYATPSLNSRLFNFGLRGVLVKNRLGRYFLMLVQQEKEASFNDYLKQPPSAPDPTCPTVLSAQGVSQKEVEARYHFTNL